ncbi:MAG TPA: flap endonuclease-1 [Candidatus Acidoferrales bacterium]|nr:flap endonuclease-1 [Candidatus Acidoferrales bacterium]
MAVDLSKLITKRKLEFEELKGKTVAIDAFNVLYQFLSIIRQPDGTPLMDSHGNVTSHLSGLFYRTIEILGYGIKPVYVFDGIPSMMKQKTIEARMRRRTEAFEEWQKAKEEGDMEKARSQAQQSTRVDKKIVESSKKLLDLMGVPYISAPSEGEAQASVMCKNGLVYAAASQDYDTLLFGSPNVVRNLTFSGRRKLPMKNVYVNVEPELVNLKDTLSNLEISQHQLIWLGIMLGTDFNMGIKGIGPKTALKMTKQASSIGDIKKLVMEKFEVEFELDVSEVEKLFIDPEVKDISEEEIEKLFEKRSDKEGLLKFMSDEHDFSRERTENGIAKMATGLAQTKQKGIGKWMK